MALDFKFPDVGEGTTEGTLIKWLIKEGDEVKADQAIAEIETDKAVVEIPCPRAGVILKLYGKSGDIIKVGSVLATIGEKGETVGARPIPLAPPVTPKSAAAPSHEISVSSSGPVSSGTVLATPATRQLARQLNVDISKVKGTGAGGRIFDEDVKNAAAMGSVFGTKPTVVQPKPTISPSKMPEPVSPPSIVSPLAHTHAEKQAWKSEGSEERIPLKGIRKTIADHMVKSMYTAVHVTHMDECDVTELVALREKTKPKLEKKGIKLTYLAFIAKACAAALQNHPWVNASIDDGAHEIVYKKYYHIGIAVDTEEGLMVPVIRNADQKNIEQIAKEMQELSEKARARKIALEDLKGSTFSITNVGSLGGVYATPVINWPEVAILGVGTLKERPVVKEGKIVARHMLTLSLAFDHRIIDGAQAVRFLNEVIQHLEDPGLFLVEVI